MTEERHKNLCESLKRLGYGRNGQIRLYGADYDLTSDPIVVADRVVLVDAIERRSGQSSAHPSSTHGPYYGESGPHGLIASHTILR